MYLNQTFKKWLYFALIHICVWEKQFYWLWHQKSHN